VWEAVERRHTRLASNGALTERRRRQSLRWLWALVEDQLRQALHAHPAVGAIRDDLERQVLAGTTPAAAAARRLLEAFGTRPALERLTNPCDVDEASRRAAPGAAAACHTAGATPAAPTVPR